jgi:hypothetical protein
MFVKSAAGLQGGLENAFLGIDKSKFHLAAKWEAGKWFLFGLVFTAVVVATADKDDRLWVVAVFGGITLVVSALRYAYVRYMVLGWRHARIMAACTQNVDNIHGDEVELNKAEFEMFLKTDFGNRVRATHPNWSASKIFDQITTSRQGSRKVTAHDIYTKMVAPDETTDITEQEIADQLLFSDAAIYKCMYNKAMLDQTARANSSGGLTDTLLALDLANAIIQ